MLTIRLLGSFKVTADGESIDGLLSPRGKSLLSYLLLHHDSPQARTHLAYTFWPDSGDGQARTNLRRELHHLRQASQIIDNLLYIDRHSVQWRMPSDSTLDAIEFERLLDDATRTTDLAARKGKYQAAIDLYQGDLLPGLYEEWVLAKREELRQRFIQTLEELTQLLVADRAYTAAIGLNQRLLQQDPLYEAGYEQLMELYALEQDRARALHTYHTCASVLERELDVPPGAEIEALYQRLLHAEDSIVEERIVTSTSVQLVGRKAEWQVVLDAWRLASQGRAHMVLMAGEAGIGKTRLAEELLEWASRQGNPVARTRAYAAEGSLAYAPIVEWLRSDFLHAAIGGLDAIWCIELARLLPELFVEFPDLPSPTPMTERWQRQRLFEALARAVTANEQPKLLLIDDLQWCDQETLEWMRFLLRFATETPLLVVGTVRSDEIGGAHPLHALTRDLRMIEQLSVVELAALSPAETAELAAQVSGQTLDKGVASRLFAASEGNPLFVVEMVRAGIEDNGYKTEVGSGFATPSMPRISVPPKVHAVIQHRLAQLSSIAGALASLAATLGRAFSFEILVAASNYGEDDVANGLDELWRRRVVREAGANRYDFSHDRIRDVIYDELTPVRRRTLHRQAAIALEDLHRDQLDPVSAQIAVHYQRAGMAEQAIVWHQHAAEAARRLYAMTESIHHLETALKIIESLPKTDDHLRRELSLLLPLSTAYVVTKGFASHEANSAAIKARDIGLKLDAKPELFYALLRIGNVNVAGRKVVASLDVARDLMALAEKIDQSMFHMEAHWLSARAHLHLGKLERAQFHVDQALRFYEDSANMPEKPDARSLLMAYLALIKWLRGYPEQAQKLIGEALLIAEQICDPFETLKTTFIARVVARQFTDREVVLALTRMSSELNEQRDMPFVKLDEDIFLAWTLAEHTLPEAIVLVRKRLTKFKDMGFSMMLTHRMDILADLHMRAGQASMALDVLDEALAFSEQYNECLWDAEVYRRRADALFAQNALRTEVEICYRRAIDIARQQDAKSLELRAATSLANYMMAQGEGDSARQLLQPIFDWFSEGFETHDLMVAKEVLRQ